MQVSYGMTVGPSKSQQDNHLNHNRGRVLLPHTFLRNYIMPVKYKQSQVYKSVVARSRNTDKHYYMHQLDNTQLWNEFFSTSNKRQKRKMRNELAMRGFSQEAIAERESNR